MDDGIFGGEVVKNSIKYNVEKDRLEFSTQQEEIDQNTPSDLRMMNMLKDIANTLDGDIVMTGDCPSNNANSKMPLLDCQVWIEQSERFPRGQILHSHF